MTNYGDVITNEDVYRSKAVFRKKRANQPFEKKLQALVRLQRMDYAAAMATGRKARKPWHSK